MASSGHVGAVSVRFSQTKTELVMRGYVLSGQFGIFGTLPDLALRLGKFGLFTCHIWNDPDVIRSARAIAESKEPGRIVFIGYSLGANETAYAASALGQYKVKLIVAYDPSRLSPLAANGEQVCPSNVEKALCYYNPYAWPYGGARLVGDQVETQQINNWFLGHLMVARRNDLHQMTYNAVQEAAQ